MNSGDIIGLGLIIDLFMHIIFLAWQKIYFWKLIISIPVNQISLKAWWSYFWNIIAIIETVGPYLIIIKQPSSTRAAYCIPLGPPPPQLFVFKIATNLSTSASSYFTYPSHTTGELF